MSKQFDTHPGGPVISAFRVYFIDDNSDKVEKSEESPVEKLIENPPTPWRTHGHERCKIAKPNADAFEDVVSAVFWVEDLGESDSVDETQAELLRALQDSETTYCMVEDISKLRAERDRLQKIRSGVNKSAASMATLPG